MAHCGGVDTTLTCRTDGVHRTAPLAREDADDEGLAEVEAPIVKVFFGALSNHLGKRKGLDAY